MKDIKNISKNEYLFFFSSLLIFIISSIIGIQKEIPFLVILPVALLLLFITIKDYSILFFLLLACLPLSLDINLGQLTLSTPSEPLMILLTGIWFILLIYGRAELKTFAANSMVVILVLQLLLFIFNIFISVEPLLSAKYLLAKIWFFIACVFVPLIILKKESDFKKAFWFFILPLMFTVLYTVIRHALSSFGFEEVNAAAKPFYLNHVIYACTLGLSLPFVIAAMGWYKNNRKIYFLLLGFVFVLLIAIVTAFTRTTWISVFAGLAGVFVFKSKFFKLSIVAAFIGLFIFCYDLVDNNKYMKYAPDYNSTVFNKDDLNKHLEATVEMSDVSGMERVYRWVAAVNLIQHHFWMGTGNNTFHPIYKEYANPAFITLMSHNPEGSSTHNYFLLIFCDQGVFGFSLFLILYLVAMIKSYHIYHQSTDKFTRTLMTACFASLLIFLVHLMLGDMVEVDKNGGIFFITISIILIFDQRRKKNQLLGKEIVTP